MFSILSVRTRRSICMIHARSRCFLHVLDPFCFQIHAFCMYCMLSVCARCLRCVLDAFCFLLDASCMYTMQSVCARCLRCVLVVFCMCSMLVVCTQGGVHSGQKHVRWDRRQPAHQNNPGTAQTTSLASVVSRKLFRSRCLNFREKIAKFGDGIPPNPPKRQNVTQTPPKLVKHRQNCSS
jgi:hypothetical protein